MDSKYCQICDFYILDFNNEDYCDYWNEPCEDIEDCDSREVDGR